MPNPFLLDDENPQWSDEQLARAVKRKRGKRFKNTCDGWQSCINPALKNADAAPF